MKENLSRQIYELASRFRMMLTNCTPEELPQIPAFANFPRGTCGDTSDLLGKYLIENGFLNVEYVNGRHRRQWHAWLEIEGLIIDITADQFQEIDESVLVTMDQSFHNRFEEQRKRHADFELLNDYTVARLSAAYTIVCSKG